MAKSCILKPCVKDGEGKIVESKLFNSLLSQFPNNSKEAWRHYDLATNDKFIADNIPNATFDEYGEINFRDYVEAVGLGEGNPSVEQALNASLQSGNYSKQEALEKVAAFNRNAPEESQYMATLRANEDGSISIFVAQATELEKETLKNEIAGMNLEDKLISLLAKHGVSVAKTSKGYSKYSTKNAVRNANGLYQLIEYSKNDTPIELAEEAGHFVVGAMTGTPLCNRLEALTSSQDVQKEILGEEYGQRDMGDSASREVAGILVGKALANKLEHTSIYYNLVMRLCNAAKKIFAKISSNEVKLAILEAESIADQFAEEFINDKMQDADIKALKTYETLYHKEIASAQESLSTVLRLLMVLRDEFKDVDASLASQIDSIIKKYSTELAPADAVELTDAMAISGIYNALYELSEFARITFTDEKSELRMDPYPKLTPSIQQMHTLQTQAKKLFLFTLFAQRLEDIKIAADIAHENYRSSFTIAAKEKAEHLRKLGQDDVDTSFMSLIGSISMYLEGGGALKGAVYECYLKSARIFAATYLEQIYGKKNIARHAHLTWQLNEVNIDEVSFEDIVTTIRQDDGGLQHLFGTLANSGDIPAQLIAKLFKENNYKAMLKKVEIQKQLSELEEEAKALGFYNSYRRFYETDSEGKLTGNLVRIISLDNIKDDAGRLVIKKGLYQINMAKYHTKEEAMWRFLKEKFIADPAGKQCAHMPAEIKRAVFRDWAKQQEAYQKFMREETIVYTNKNNNEVRIPNPYKYANTINSEGNPVVTLTQNEIDWLKKYNKVWKECRALVGEEKMPSYFAPQVKGTKTNTIGNIMRIPKIKNKWAMAKHLTREAWRSIWNQDPQYLDKQNYYNYRTASADPVDQFFQEENAALQEIKKATSIPLYYVRKLQDSTTIDTNLIAATSHFVSMAAHYSATKEIQSSLEVTINVLSKRTNESNKKENRSLANIIGKAIIRPKNSTESLVQKTIEDHVESLIYGRNKTWFHTRFGNKLVPIANRALTLYYLGGNILSQLVNLINGFWEVFKEALVGEYFTFDTFVKANVIYILNLPGLMYDMATMKDHTKINLFLEKFGVLGSAGKKYSESRVFLEKLFQRYLNPSAILLGGYSLAEHYMQTIPYMCVAMETKIYTKSGERSLWSALTPSAGMWDRRKNKEYSLDLTEEAFVDYRSYSLHSGLKVTLETLENELQHNESLDIVTFLQENNSVVIDILNSYGIQENDIEAMNKEDVVQVLKNILDSYTWTASHEANFVAKAREITNRMHGVYNDLDKTVLHRNLVGALLLPFKGYAFGMIQRRYGGLLGGAKYSIALDNEDEGSNVTTMKVGLRTVKSIVAPFTSEIHGAIKEKDINRWWRNSAKGIMQTFATAGATLLPASKKFRATIAQYSGLSTNQVYNLRRSTIDWLGIYSTYHLMTLIKSLLLGEDEEEDPSAHTLNSAIDLAYELGLIVEDTSGLPEYYMREQDIKRAYADAWEEAQLLIQEGVEITDINAYAEKKAVEYMIKNVNLYYKETRSHSDNKLLNLSYYILNRFHREQSAFNTWAGLQTEGKAALSITPLSFSFANEMYNLCTNYVVTYGFKDERVQIEGSSFTVNELISKINDPNVDNKVKAIYKKAVIQKFVSAGYGTESEFKQFYHTTSKTGYNQWGENKATSKLSRKSPRNRMNRVLEDGIRAAEDYNSAFRY